MHIRALNNRHRTSETKSRVGTWAGLSLMSATVAACIGMVALRAEEISCPAALKGARQLVLVTTPNMRTTHARLRWFERSGDDDPWRTVGQDEPAVVGSAGLAWGAPFRWLAQNGELMKSEGDKRTPAGVYKIGRSFGFAAAPRPGHLILKTRETICVDDPASPAYNTIAPRSTIGRASGEDMRTIGLYRRGLVIEYPTFAAQRAGSCIFIHIWRAPGRGTAGCVALPESRIVALQAFAQDGAAIAVLPVTSLERLPGCLPTPQ